MAIEAAQAENGMELDSDGEQRFPGRRHDPTHGRALVNRETRGLGLYGNIPEVRRRLVRGRKKEVSGQKAKDLQVSKIFFKQRHRNPVSYLR